MTPSSKNIWILWKGERSGPFDEKQLIEKVYSGQIGRLYSVIINGCETTAGEFVDSRTLPNIRKSGNEGSSSPVKAEPLKRVTAKLEIEPQRPVRPPDPVPNSNRQPNSTTQQAPDLPVLVTVVSKGKTYGPFTFESLRQQISHGAFTPDDLSWHEGLPDWVRLGDLPVPDSIPPVTNLPPLPPMPPEGGNAFQNAFSSKPKYPKWPWISFAICFLLWLSFSSWEANIEDEARPFINESSRMSTTDYAVASGIEAFFRGAAGDPFGKANEEYNKAGHIQDRLSQLSADYDSAKAGAGFFFLLTLVFGGLWIWRHVKFVKLKRICR